MRNKKIVYSLIALGALTTIGASISFRESGIRVQTTENNIFADSVNSSGKTEFNTTIGTSWQSPLINPDNGAQLQGGGLAGVDKVIEDPNNPATNQVGNFTLDQVPAKFDFGEHPIYAADGEDFSVKTATPISDSVNQNSGSFAFQITDFRTADDVASGQPNDYYTLEATLSNFVNSDNVNIGTGVYLTFVKSNKVTMSTIRKPDYPSQPYSRANKINAGGTSAVIIDAQKGVGSYWPGKGTWKITYLPKDIVLHIPKQIQTSIGSFEATLTYTLKPVMQSS